MFLSVCVHVHVQGYERVRRSSDEEISLMRAHDLEEGTSLDSHSSSSDSQSEEVNRHTRSSHWFLIFHCRRWESHHIVAHDWHKLDLMVLYGLEDTLHSWLINFVTKTEIII